MSSIFKKMKKGIASLKKRVYLASHIGCDNNLIKNKSLRGQKVLNKIFKKVKKIVDNEMELSRMILLPDKGNLSKEN